MDIQSRTSRLTIAPSRMNIPPDKAKDGISSLSKHGYSVSRLETNYCASQNEHLATDDPRWDIVSRQQVSMDIQSRASRLTIAPSSMNIRP